MSSRPGQTRPAAVLIAGPTASGKSELAMRVADRAGGRVINCDSMQVYRELRILTARPSNADEARAPHALYGHVPAAEAYSAGRYVSEASAAIAAARAAGQLPILTGGTGLYFKALLEGLAPVPQVPEDVRAHWRGEAQRVGAAALHAVLAARDPAMAARLAVTDAQRIVRALEVLDATGRSLAAWQAQTGPPVLDASATLCLRLSLDRAALHERADRRFDAMMAAGALDEAASLAALNLPPELPAMRAIGVAPLMAACRGDITPAEAADAAKAETRQYIKRQETWFRKYMISWRQLSAQKMESIEPIVMSFIDL